MTKWIYGDSFDQLVMITYGAINILIEKIKEEIE